jgi:short-subunit dehydrogenase
MSEINNSRVCITGGASGIGLLMAEKCGQEGASLIIICDNNEIKLKAAETRLSAMGYPISAHLLDVTDEQAVDKFIVEILGRFGTIDILINNAGIITSNRYFHVMDTVEITRTMMINSIAPMYMTRQLLPAMISSGKGHIVNIASAASHIANPKLSVYCASKHALLGWSESLRLELEMMATKLKVTTVTPSFIDTGMFQGVRSPLIPLIRPEAAARQIISGIKKNKIYVRMPWIVYILPLFKGLLPQRWMDFLVGKIFGFHKSMDDFTGRK